VLGTTEYLEKQHDQGIYPEMAEKYTSIFKTKTADEWMEIMSQHDICAAPVMEMDRAVTDPHNTARNMVIEVDSPVGKVKQIGIGAKLSETPGQVRSTSPLLGQHTDDILKDLGYGGDAVADLKNRGVVG
jgi:crotonobetainyl-CoA:carnitine CoA-transferase CaiB-like acyl-CoA transferase